MGWSYQLRGGGLSPLAQLGDSLSPFPPLWKALHRSGCIGPHSDAIPVYLELLPLLPHRWVPSLTSPCWLCSSSWYEDDLELSWTREPPNAAPVELRAVGPCVLHAKASVVFFRKIHVCCVDTGESWAVQKWRRWHSHWVVMKKCSELWRRRYASKRNIWQVGLHLSAFQ